MGCAERVTTGSYTLHPPFRWVIRVDILEWDKGSFMELLTLLAADYANVAEGGKVNVLGIFRNILASDFPVRHNSMVLVVKLGADLGEYDQQRVLTILLVDEDGNEIMRLAGNIKIPNPVGGQRPEVNALLTLKEIVFPKPGRYQFSVLVDKDHKGSLSIDVVKVQNEKE